MELERKKAFLIRAGYWIAVIAASYLIARYALRLLLPLVLGFVIAYLLRPVCGFLRKHSGIGARGAAIVSDLLFYTAFGALVWGIFALLLFAGDKAIEALPQWYSALRPALAQWNAWIVDFLSKLSPHTGLSAGQLLQRLDTTLGTLLLSASSWGMEVLNRFLAALPMLLTALLVTILSSALIGMEYTKITGFLLRQIPHRLHTTVQGMFIFLFSSIGKICKAYFFLMLITFAVLSAGFWALGVENLLLPAGLIAVVDVLPVLGSGLALVPWGLYRLCTGDFFTGGGLLALWGLLIFLRQILEPRLVGGQLGQHPLLTLAAMYAGLRIAGVSGLLFAPVLCLMLQYLHDQGILKLYKEEQKEK